MFREWTFGRKVGAGFSVAGLVLILVAIFGYQSTHRLIENDVWVRHTYQVRLELGVLLARLTDAETGQRGFVLTGEDPYLEPYTAALAEVRRATGELRTLTADNPGQVQRLDAIQPLVDNKFAELARTIDLRRTQGAEAALVVVRGGDGRRWMEQIRGIVAAMDRDEVDLLARRRTASEESAASTKAVILWGSVAGLILVALIGWYLTRSLTEQIGAAVGHMHASSAELQAAANQQASGTREQATAMTEISTTINELLATSRQISESAQRVSQIAEETASGVGRGTATVQSGHESINEIRRQVDLIVSGMLELGRKSQRVGVVLDIVSELAEQTNILAINATIEAAGAGEAGKRFGVVADEIRKLADRVAGSTKEIRSLIEDVRSAVNTTVMTTETGSKAVDAGARQFAEVALAFKQLGSLVNTTMEAAREIDLSTKQQSNAVEQVNTATMNVAQTTREAESSTTQTLQTALQLAGLSGELLKLVQPQAAS